MDGTFSWLELDDAIRFQGLGRELIKHKRSMSAVSEALEEEGGAGVSHSTLLKLITKMEKRTGQKLVESEQKKGNKASLTDEGRSFLAICRERIAQEVEGFRSTADAADLKGETIRIATHHMISTYLLPTLISQFVARKENKARKLDFEVHDIANFPQGIEQLREGRVDILIDCPPLIGSAENVVTHDFDCPFFRLVMVPRKGAGSALLKKEKGGKNRVTLESLTTVPLCYVLSGDLAGSIPQSLLPRVTVDSLAAVHNFIANGFVGIGMNWKELLSGADDEKHGFEVRWLASTLATRRLNSSLHAMAAHRDLPTPSTTVLSFVEAVGDAFRAQAREEPPPDIADAERSLA